MRVNLPITNSSIPIKKIENVLEAALDAADPYKLVKKNLKLFDDVLLVGDKELPVLPSHRIILLGLGKASLEMMRAGMDILSKRVNKSVCVCKHLSTNLNGLELVTIFEAGHPIPDDRSIEGASSLMHAVEGLSQDDLVILLLSGGGSALACLPAEGIALQDIQTVTSGLLKSGASINELNAVRKHLDLIKGGGLLKTAKPAQVEVLVISDVVNNPLDVIASGPTVPDPSTFKVALEILQRYLGKHEIPSAILSRLERGVKGEIAETLKKGDEETEKANHTVIASNLISALAAQKAAKREGFETEIITTELVGEAHSAGEKLAELLKAKSVGLKPYLGIAGGETTVKVTGKGLGGRNLEVALGAVCKMSGLSDGLLVTLATDGEDGPTEAAGAYVTGETYNAGKALGLEPESFLSTNDAYHYFKQVGGLILTGPSGTNVNDLNFVFKNIAEA